MSLSDVQQLAIKRNIQNFCRVAEQYEAVWHYSQARPFTGLGRAPNVTHWDDCSAYISLAYYYASKLSGFGIADPLGEHFSGWGNTGTAYEFLKDHPKPAKDKCRRGDVALYLEAGSYPDHVTICRAAGTKITSRWSSFGQEAGPMEVRLGYRSDLTGVFRHPALQ